jgi:ABC-type polysaccharide/polyol phosphate export permease
MCARLVVLFLEVLTLVGFGHFAFGVPLRGSVGTLLLICVLAAVSFGGLGLLTASRARTTEAVSGIMNFIMLPMWIFSGVFFSSSNFPNVVQPFIKLLPLTAVNDALRANMLEGASFAAVGGQSSSPTSLSMVSASSTEEGWRERRGEPLRPQCELVAGQRDEVATTFAADTPLS